MKWILSELKNLLLPQCCCFCDEEIAASEEACQFCQQLLPWLDNSCKFCGLHLVTAEVCGNCIKKRPLVNQIVSIFYYQPPLSNMLIAMKYFNKKYFVRTLGLLLAENLAIKLQQQQVSVPDAIIAVPMHPKKLRQRGFNQSHEIAKILSQELNISFIKNACEAIKLTSAQASLDYKARQQNLKGAFKVVKPLPANITIIDDVITTTATINELATTLQQVGVKRIDAWSVCRTHLA